MSLSKKVISRIQKMFSAKFVLFKVAPDWNGGLSGVSDSDLELIGIYDSIDEATAASDYYNDPFFFALDVEAGEIHVIQQGGAKVTDVVSVV